MVIGEMSDVEVIDSALAGAGAVVSALGPSLDRKAVGTPLIAGTENIVAAMKEHGVRRVIGHATPAVWDPHEKPTFTTRLIRFLPKTFGPRAFEEITGMSRALMGSGLDWTIVRFVRPTDGPKQGRVRAGFWDTDKLGWAVTRADIAAFTAQQVDDTTYIGRAPSVSNRVSGASEATGEVSAQTQEEEHHDHRRCVSSARARPALDLDPATECPLND